MQGYDIVKELPNAKISLTETKGPGTDKDMIECSNVNPCGGVGEFVDAQAVTKQGLWQTVTQSFAVHGHAVSAMVVKPDGAVVAEGEKIVVTITDSGSTFKGN